MNVPGTPWFRGRGLSDHGPTGHRDSRPGHDPGRVTPGRVTPDLIGLRALAELIAGAAQPALAGPMLSESSRSTLHLPSRMSGSRTSNEPATAKIPSDPDEPPPPAVGDDDIEAEHVETWRLVQAVQNGDGEAFGELYDRYVNQVFRFIYYRVNDRALAEDFTSETFLRALRRISSINYQGRDIGAWFMTIARNIVFDHTKSARFRLEQTTGETVESGDAADSPETAVLAHLTNTRLLSAVNELGEEQRECIVLRFLHGLSVAETAAVMGKNDGAIKALQHRAVKRLAGMLGDELR